MFIYDVNPENVDSDNISTFEKLKALMIKSNTCEFLSEYWNLKLLMHMGNKLLENLCLNFENYSPVKYRS